MWRSLYSFCICSPFLRYWSSTGNDMQFLGQVFLIASFYVKMWSAETREIFRMHPHFHMHGKPCVLICSWGRNKYRLRFSFFPLLIFRLPYPPPHLLLPFSFCCRSVVSHHFVVPRRRMCGVLSALPIRFHVILFSCKDIISCKFPSTIRLESKEEETTTTTTTTTTVMMMMVTVMFKKW
jgi:hypothetical protein